MTAPEQPDGIYKTLAAPRAIESRPGVHMPSEGNLRALVLFTQSKDDNYPSDTWPVGEFPEWAQTMADELHEYYLRTSNNKLNIQFDIYPEYIVSKSTELEYLNAGKRYGDYMKEVIGELDATMNFDEYDKWQTIDRPFRPVPGTDGSIDLFMVFHRSILHPGWMPHTGVSDLMFAGSYYVDENTRRFFGGSGYANDASSSGLIVTGYPGRNYVLDYQTALTVVIHEIQHKLLTDVHTTESFARLGVMSANASGLAMCAMERHLLGYISIPMLPYDADTVLTLKDYVTTDDAVAIPIKENDRYYYILEYRTKKHPYDTAPEEGVFIYRVNDNWSTMQKEILVITADGQWDWKINDSTGYMERTAPNTFSGYNPLEKIVIDGKPYWHHNYRGYEGMAFTPSRSPMGMYRNPASDFILKGDTIHTNLTVTVLDMDGDEATISITHTPPKVVSAGDLHVQQFSLGAGYPNPASVSARVPVTVPYALRRSSDVALTVYDALGRSVYESARRHVAPGNDVFIVPVASLAPGSYTCRLLTNTGSAHKRLIITK